MKIDVISSGGMPPGAVSPLLIPPQPGATGSMGMGMGVVPWIEMPSTIELRTRVLTDIPPLASWDESKGELLGFMPQVMDELQRVALEKDNVSLTFDVDIFPADFSQAINPYEDCLSRISIDCNTTFNEMPWSQCNQYDLMVGDFWPTMFDRSLKHLFTPALLSTGLASLRLSDDYYLTLVNSDASASNKHRLIKSLEEAHAVKAPVCLTRGFSLYHEDLMTTYPNLNITHCDNHVACISLVKNCSCSLYVADELRLRRLYVEDEQLDVTSEHGTAKHLVTWALHSRLQPNIQFYISKWVYDIIRSGFLDRLYLEYYSPQRCPIGLSGMNCDKPCDPIHGISDRHGNCVCDSTKWTGDDCSVEVAEDYNHVPKSLKATSWVMLGINFTLVILFGCWLIVKRATPQVTVAQPHFLGLVLLGCVVSTSTIIPLALQDDCEANTGAITWQCQAVPILYSLGFCITFGTLFAKILRVYRLFRAASKLKRTVVTTFETLGVVAIIAGIDAVIVVVWSIVDPLRWIRVVVMADKFGNPLLSEGYCTSENWNIFAGLIGAYHFGLMIIGCYLCYVARDVPTEFSEGRYLTITMVSNLQVFLVGVPVLLIAGANAQISFFVRSILIWLNDFMVLTLIFGHLIKSVHFGPNNGPQNKTELIQSALRTYCEDRESRSSNTRPFSGLDISTTGRVSGLDSSITGKGGVSGMDYSTPGMDSSCSRRHRYNLSVDSQQGAEPLAAGIVITSSHTSNTVVGQQLDVVEEGRLLVPPETDDDDENRAEMYKDEDGELLPMMKKIPSFAGRRNGMNKQDSTRTI